MKPASQALRTLLASRQFYMADLYTFTLIGGGVLRYTTADSDLRAGGNTFASTGPRFDRQASKAKCHWKLGVEVDSLVFDVMPQAADLVNGQPFLSAVVRGAFDGAELQLERAFMASFGNTAAGTVILFVGRVAEVDAGRTSATFTINSHLELLNQQMPRNMFQPGCVNTLYDASCTLASSSFAVAGTTAAGSAPGSINATLGQATGYFDQGRISFASGANSGLSRSIKTHVGGTPSVLSLLAPFPNAPAPGDAFTLYPGCDKAQATCQGKFNNLANFRGFPYVPNPETAL
jgi:uncharacterized phage protein (TIGR02218 family)